jgi:lipid A 3-O-deacylase
MAMVAAPAMAQQATPEMQTPYGVYLEGGGTLEATSKGGAAGIGFTFPFGQRHELWGGALTSYGDIFVSQWRARRPIDEGTEKYTQVGAIANWRLRFDQGNSPWFMDAGIGATVLDHIYQTPGRAFSTRFQFTEVLGIGRSFGATGAHEIQLRLQHVSNGGIKEPNPGENFAKLRYQYHF